MSCQIMREAHSRLAASTRQIETLTLLTERQRMARELHDTLAQGIAGMIMQLEVTSAQMDRKNYLQAQHVLSQALSCARTTLQDARYAITDLRSRTPCVDQLVESYLNSIYTELNVDSRAAAVAIAIERGLLPHRERET